MTTTTNRNYTGPTAREIADRLSERTVRSSQGWWRVRGICHGGESLPGSLTIADRDRGGIAVHCFVGCERQTVIDTLEVATGWPIWDAWDGASVSRPQPDPAERQRQIEMAKAKQREQERLAAEAAVKAQRMIDAAEFGPHPYLEAKGFPEAQGLVLDGELLIPMRHFKTGRLQTLQRIREDGSKRFLYGGKAQGTAFRMGRGFARWYCEGYATGLSIQAALAHLYRRDQVVVCFSAHGLPPAAAYDAWPEGYVVADHDLHSCPKCRHRWDAAWEQRDYCPACGNTDVTPPAGEKYARATGLPFWMPPRSGTDANDFGRTHGVKALATALRGVMNGD